MTIQTDLTIGKDGEAMTIQTEQDIQQASRRELEDYLTSWGFQVYDDEETIELRIAALENWETEGPGFGPVKV